MPCPSRVPTCPGPDNIAPGVQIPGNLCHVCRGKVNISRRRQSIRQMADRPVTDLQTGWTLRSLMIVRDLYDEMWQVSPAPCEYAFCLTGSGARGEACPYSDLDAFIVLETESLAIKQRFTEVSMFVKNMLAAMSVMDTHSVEQGTPIKGFVFCIGGLNPLGLKEMSSSGGIGGVSQKRIADLTDTVPNLARILENYYSDPANSDNKDLTHIAQGLQETAFGFGNEALHDQLVREVDRVMGRTEWLLSSDSELTRKRRMGLELIQEAATKVEFDLPRRPEDQYHIKLKFIRVPQFVLKGLYWYYNLMGPDLSSWSLIDQLTSEGILHPSKAMLFRRSLTLAHGVRIKSHLAKESEADIVQTHDSPWKDMVPDYAMTEEETAELREITPYINEIRKLAKEFWIRQTQPVFRRDNPFASPRI